MINYKGWEFPDNDSHFFPWVEEFPNTNYQQESIELSYNYVKKFNCVIDIGSNIGLHTVRFSNKFDTVHSFEPVSYNFKCLKKNTELYDNVILYNQGLGEGNGVAEIKLPKTSINYGAFSIVDYADCDQPLLIEEIKISTLDSFSLSPDLIKIDTQGFEIPVLLGAQNTIKMNKPVLIIEIENKKEIEKYRQLMLTFGYTNYKRISKDYIWWVD